MKLGLFKISYIVIAALNFIWYFYFTQIELIFIFPLLYGILYLVYIKFFKSVDDEPFHSLGDLGGLLLGNLYLILYGQQVYQDFSLFSIEAYLVYLVFMVQGYMVVTSIIYITRYLIDLKSKEIVGQYDKIDTFFSFIYVISIVFILILSTLMNGFSFVTVLFAFDLLLMMMPFLLIYLLYKLIRKLKHY